MTEKEKGLVKQLQEVVENLIDEGEHNEDWAWTKEIVSESIEKVVGDSLINPIEERIKQLESEVKDEDNDFTIAYASLAGQVGAYKQVLELLRGNQR